MNDKPLVIAGKEYTSRLIVGTGKYKTLPLMKEALTASGAEMVTVAIRRVNLQDKSPESFWNHIPEGMTILPNTAGCYTAGDAVRIARLAREVLQTPLIKLEVLGDTKTLLPDTQALLEATKQLVKEGFTVLPYTNDDPILAKRLEESGAAAVMPLAAPIGSGRGVQNPLNIQFILETVTHVPVIVDAGVGTASDAAVAMELGVDGVLMNTAIADAQDPVLMAKAMQQAVSAGRHAFLAGRMEKKIYAAPSSPTQGVVAPLTEKTSS
ncbi:MAG TPA: thiazole synthase [Elusimicrobiota bacterium]|nr:thiazole synthase [Elusimicrobiota bacterium]